jgi:hypothetical protein
MRFFLLVFLLFLFTSCKKEKNRICEIYAGEIGYEIGIIQKYVSGPGKVTYSHSYSVNGINYTGKIISYGIGQKNERLIGKSFLVVYLINNPSESDLNFDYPVKSEAELKELENKFVNNPPKPSWPKCK